MVPFVESASLEELFHIRQILSEHFSKNEDIEEIKTADLPYIATDYFIALKYLSTSVGGTRIDNLRRANFHLNQFLNWLSIFSLGEKPTEAKDPAQSRQQKINRFQRMKDLQIDPSSIKDEESQRNFWLRWLKIKGLMAFDECSLVNAELELLSKKEADKSHSSMESKLAEPVIRTIQPFVLMKEKVRETVFRPGHNLPSMTVDEFLGLEMQRRNIISGTGETKQPEDPENDIEFDIETSKLRKRDERWGWMTKGYGNTYNRS